MSSGGFYKPYAPVHAAAVTSFSMKKIPNASPSPIIHAKPHHYRSDGSGRDLYIGINEGGLSNSASFVKAEARFIGSLRESTRT